MRKARDFQPRALRAIRDAGFTGVFLNGGSGIGPDMLSPETLVSAPPLESLVPRSGRHQQAEAHRRLKLVRCHGLSPWLVFWGVPGPDQSRDSGSVESNKLFDRRTKLEMHAALHSRPELFGYRDPRKLNWRGSRPLCVSHPDVRTFYDNLGASLVQQYPGLGGILFFPGDSGPELCDEHCPRCQARHARPWAIMVDHVNRLSRSFHSAAPNLPFYVGLWNLGLQGGDTFVDWILDELAPGIGVAMSISDCVTQDRRGGTMTFHQPWSNMAQPGEQFLRATALAADRRRPVMVLGELAQSEVWDPVCHNLPLPMKIRSFLRNANDVAGVNAIMDFWGHRGPFVSHANLEMMREVLHEPHAKLAEHLALTARRHYGLPPNECGLMDQAIACWQQVNAVVDNWALVSWFQRFSFAIGRMGARGRLYGPLIPPILRPVKDRGYIKALAPGDDVQAAEDFHRLQSADRDAFIGVGQVLHGYAKTLRAVGCEQGAAIADEEGNQMELAGELLTSISRFVLAARCFHAAEWDQLRETVDQEIAARDRQLAITGRLNSGAGVQPQLVEEDINNMCLFLTSERYPDVPDEWFSLTPTPYTM